MMDAGELGCRKYAMGVWETQVACTLLKTSVRAIGVVLVIN